MASLEGNGFDHSTSATAQKRSAAVTLVDSSGVEVTPLTSAQALALYALPANFISGVISSDVTHTTTATLIAAQTGTTRYYIDTIVIKNANATQGGWVGILDATTTIFNAFCAANGGGPEVALVTPIRCGVTSGLFIQCGTTGMNVRANVVGYKGP